MGFSLVELLVSIAVGLVIMAGVTNIYVNTIRSNSDTLKMTRLNQELRSVMAFMTRDIRRAGYWGKAKDSVTGPASSNSNPFTLSAPSEFAGQLSNSCLMYTYDYNQNGTLDNDNDERHGFRLKANAVQVVTSNSSATCNTGTWENITDDDGIQITNLTFTAVDTSVGITTPSVLTVRNITIKLTGQLTTDTTVQRTLSDTVRIANDVYSPN